MAMMLGLPEIFLMKNEGGGMIASSISDAVFQVVNAAKKKKLRDEKIELNDPRIL